jgi:hypothetical protein
MRLFAIVLCVAGCGSMDDGMGGGAMSSAQFSLSAANVQWASSIMNQRPMTGRSFLTLTATIKNTGESSPLSTAYPLFSVLTKEGLAVQTSPYSSLLMPACAADLSVANGGMVACGLAFEIPTGDTPTELDYTDPTMRHASVAISVSAPPPPSCGSSVVGNPSSTCQNCGQQHCPAEASAIVNANGCLQSVMCVQNKIAIGACADFCSPCTGCPTSSACSQALTAFAQCISTNCSNVCN